MYFEGFTTSGSPAVAEIAKGSTVIDGVAVTSTVSDFSATAPRMSATRTVTSFVPPGSEASGCWKSRVPSGVVATAPASPLLVADCR